MNFCMYIKSGSKNFWILFCRYKSDSRDQSRGYERRHRSEDSPKRKSSQERTYSRERKRNSDHQRSSQ